MTNPTHLLKDGTAVFPQGYEPEDLTLIPDGYWEARELADAKAGKWEQVKAMKITVQDGGFNVSGVGRFDSDLVSRDAIRGMEDGDLWTLADNREALIENASIIIAAMNDHMKSAHMHAMELRRQISAASTINEVREIEWQLN